MFKWFLIPLQILKGGTGEAGGVVRKKMSKHLWAFLFILLSVPFAHADDAAIDMSRQMQIASLKREISELEIKLAECSRKNKNWRTATWVGAAGTVATGTAAIVQGVKLNKLKKENESAGKTEKPTTTTTDKKDESK